MDIPKYQIQELQREIQDKSSMLYTIVERYVGTYCSDLDSYMKRIQNKLEERGADLSDYELEEITLKLPQYMYWATQGQEYLNIKEEVAKAIKNEKFIATVESLESGSVGLKNKKGDNETLMESLVQYLYGYSSKIIKGKISYATEMLQSVKKIISKRMAVSEYSNTVFRDRQDNTVIRTDRRKERDRF